MARYRAAYWTDGSAEVVLTAPEHAALPDEELLAEARAEAERAGVDLSDGRIEIGDWEDSSYDREAIQDAEMEGLRAYARMAADEERGLRERGEWPRVVAAAREELVASGWHHGTSVRALAARLHLTHRTAESAVSDVMEAMSAY